MAWVSGFLWTIVFPPDGAGNATTARKFVGSRRPVRGPAWQRQQPDGLPPKPHGSVDLAKVFLRRALSTGQFAFYRRQTTHNAVGVICRVHGNQMQYLLVTKLRIRGVYENAFCWTKAGRKAFIWLYFDPFYGHFLAAYTQRVHRVYAGICSFEEKHK
jgi:hypothetical protein